MKRLTLHSAAIDIKVRRTAIGFHERVGGEAISSIVKGDDL